MITRSKLQRQSSLSRPSSVRRLKKMAQKMKKRILHKQKVIIQIRVTTTKKQARMIMKIHPLQMMSRIKKLRSPRLFSKTASMSTRGS